MAGALVKHPKGAPLIDTGFGRNIDEQFGRYRGACVPLLLEYLSTVLLGTGRR